GSADAGSDPTTSTTRHAFDLITTGFGPGSNGPLQVAVHLPSPAARTTVDAFDRQVSTLPDVVAVTQPSYNPAGTAAVITVIPATAPQASATSDLVNRLRHQVVPSATAGTGVKALVGGETAAAIDTSNVTSRHLPLVLSFVVLVSLLLLARAFRSV